jgi:beta-xylosidase
MAENNDILILPAIFEGSRDLKDRSKKLTFCTNEINPQQAASLQVLVQQFCYIAIKREDFKSEEIEILNAAKTDFDDQTKSPSTRMRSVLYLLWKQDNNGYGDFQLYYNYHMNIFIGHLKGKIL